MSGLPPVIVFGVDTPIGLSVVRELGRYGVPVHGIGKTATAIGSASRYLSSFAVRPKGQPIAKWLPAIIDASGAQALFAISEGDLLDLAKLEPAVEGCRILTPRAAQLDLVLDKSQTLEVAQSVGIDVPISWQPVSAALESRPEALHFPMIAKWSDPPAILSALDAAGIAFLKAELLEGEAGLRAMLTRYARLGVWPLVQSFCPGHGLGQMVHMANGKASLTFQHQRIHEWPPEGGVSTLCETVPVSLHQTQMAKSEALLAKIGWEGPAMVEYRFDPATQTYWLMEINGRFWGSLPLARHAGAHFVWEQYIHAFPDVARPKRAAIGARKARFMIPETRRLITILRTGAAEGRLVALWRYMAGFFDPHMRYYVFEWADPKPMLRDMFNIIQGGGRTES